MSAPFPVAPKRATIDVVVELSRHQVPPTLPFELKDHVSANAWETRVSTLVRLASRYCRPTLERAYLATLLLLTFLVPITTYYIALQTLDSPTRDVAQQVWLARFSAFAITIAMWIILSVPIVLWKYLGKVRVMRLAEQWTREDALAAPSYGAAPVWKASPPGLFRDAIVLVVGVPLSKKSHFELDRDSSLPPYIAVGDDALPPYGGSNAARWSRGPKGGIKYGDLPMYADGESNAV